MARSPSASVCRTNHGRSARRWAAIRSPSSCPAIACWAPTARWAASRPTGASPPNGGSWRSRARPPSAPARCSRVSTGAMAEFGFDPKKAVRHLKAADPALGEIIRRIGPFAMELKSSRSLFGALAEAIVYQQLSNKAAATIYGRVEALFPRATDGFTPRHILKASGDSLRGCGLSRAKVAAVQDLARRVQAGELPTLEECQP